MTVNCDAWNPADHPRGTAGRFSAKYNSAPESLLATDGPREAPVGLLVPALEDIPYHQRVAIDEVQSQEDNPLLASFREGDSYTAQEWLDAIEAHFGDPEERKGNPLCDEVRDLLGTPRNEGDVYRWMARVDQWRSQAKAVLTAEQEGTVLGT